MAEPGPDAPAAEVIRGAVVHFGGKIIGDLVLMQISDMQIMIESVTYVLIKAIRERQIDA